MSSQQRFYVLNIFTNISDPERFTRDYASKVPAILKQYGGSYVVRRGNPQLLKGPNMLEFVVILDFPDKTAALAWFNSPEYNAVVSVRGETSSSSVYLLEGYVPS